MASPARVCTNCKSRRFEATMKRTSAQHPYSLRRNLRRRILVLLNVLLTFLVTADGAHLDRASSRISFAPRTLPVIRGGDDGGYEILKEEVLHDSWRKLIRRKVQLPSKLTADFEVVGQRGTDSAVLVFVWNSQTKTAVMIREYMPSVHHKMMGLAAGMVEEKHDGDDDDPSLTAARHELEEECRLTGGTFIRLCDKTVMDKYSTTCVTAYLVIDPKPIHKNDAKPRDPTEEGMEVIENVSVSEIRDMIERGQMTIVGGWASQLALHRLRELKEID